MNPGVLVLGASRGIGLELVRQHLADGARVVATARDDAGLQRLAGLGAKALKLDVADASSCAGLAWQLDGEAFHTAWLVAGVYGPKGPDGAAPAQADFDRVMHTNVLAAMRLLPVVAQALANGGRVGVLSSRMGSIGARAAPNGSLYRASKAALNSVLKDFSLATAGRAVAVSFHPGWVRTDMGGAGADLPVAKSAADLRATLARAAPKDHGAFLNHDGTPIPW